MIILDELYLTDECYALLTMPAQSYSACFGRIMHAIKKIFKNRLSYESAADCLRSAECHLLYRYHILVYTESM